MSVRKTEKTQSRREQGKPFLMLQHRSLAQPLHPRARRRQSYLLEDPLGKRTPNISSRDSQVFSKIRLTWGLLQNEELDSHLYRC